MAVIVFPWVSSNFSEKSLNNHNSEGKYFASSSALATFSLEVSLIVFDKLTINDNEFIEFSSIVPKLLSINRLDISTAIRNIFESWLISSSYAPRPSVSIKNILNFSLKWLFCISIGSDHIHIPLVHGLIVGPTLNPLSFDLFSNTLLRRNDLPVR